jgi:hypothetical protein
MTTPTFSADKSLYASSRHYVTHGYTGSVTGEISPALIGGGGFGLGGGGLNAWGCWNTRCCTRWGQCCLPTPRGRQCWTCCIEDEACERCIWPW